MTTFADRLIESMEEKGFKSDADLARAMVDAALARGRKIKVSSASVGQWKAGQNPSGERLALIADVLGKSVNWLLWGEAGLNHYDIRGAARGTRQLTVKGHVQEGAWQAQDEWPQQRWLEAVINDRADYQGREINVLQVLGDGFAPQYPHETLLIFDVTNDLSRIPTGAEIIVSRRSGGLVMKTIRILARDAAGKPYLQRLAGVEEGGAVEWMDETWSLLGLLLKAEVPARGVDPSKLKAPPQPATT